MPPAGIKLALPAPKLPQTYAIYLAATGNGDCGVTSLKVTGWEGKFCSEMNIAIEQRKAICVHFTRVQLPYLRFVIRLCSISSAHSASLKLLDWNSVTAVLVSLP
jgi:hypothetical protein